MNKKVKLNITKFIGENAFLILGKFQKRAKKEGWTEEEIDLVFKQAKSSDYQNLCRIIMNYCK